VNSFGKKYAKRLGKKKKKDASSRDKKQTLISDKERGSTKSFRKRKRTGGAWVGRVGNFKNSARGQLVGKGWHDRGWLEKKLSIRERLGV